eukprot:2458990-Lingulodinium_polyedra.AAC.1
MRPIARALSSCIVRALSLARSATLAPPAWSRACLQTPLVDSAMPCDMPGDGACCSDGPLPWAVYCRACDMWLNGSS